MQTKDQLLDGYAAGRRGYAPTFARRPFWDRLVFVVAIIVGGRGTESWLGHHSTLALGWRFLIAIGVASLCGVAASVLLDKLRSLNQS